MVWRQPIGANPETLLAVKPLQVIRSEGAAAVEEDEDHGGAGDRDQKQGRKVGDQMEIDSHGRAALQRYLSFTSLRSALRREQRSCKLL